MALRSVAGVVALITAAAALLSGCSSDNEPRRVTPTMSIVLTVDAEAHIRAEYQDESGWKPEVLQAIEAAPDRVSYFKPVAGGVEKTEVRKDDPDGDEFAVAVFLHRVAQELGDKGTLPGFLPTTPSLAQRLATALLVEINDGRPQWVYPANGPWVWAEEVDRPPLR